MRHNLIETRQKAGMTQIQVAKRIGISTRQLQRIELGEQDGTIKTWQKITSLFALGFDFLLVND